MAIIWGLFAFGDRFGGSWLRLMPPDDNDGVINSAVCAQESIVYEMEETP